MTTEDATAIKSHADFGGDTAAKAAWISRHGLQAYESLPTQRPMTQVNLKTITAAEWRALPISKKTAILSDAADPEAPVGQIMKRF